VEQSDWDYIIYEKNSKYLWVGVIMKNEKLLGDMGSLLKYYNNNNYFLSRVRVLGKGKNNSVRIVIHKTQNT
jgi:hypothetical protein